MSDQFEPQEAKVLLNFLDRVQLQGHAERNSMNILFAKLQMIATPPPADPPKKPKGKKS